MKLTVLTEDLKKTVSGAARFTNIKAQLPVLGNILLKVDKAKLWVMATNLEMSYASAIGAKVINEGEITVPGRTLLESIVNFPAGQVELEVKKETLTLTCEGINVTIAGLNASDFPKIQTKVGEGATKLSGEVLKESLGKVLFSTSLDETRPILTGVLFAFGKSGLTLVSSDGFRLSQKKVKMSGGQEQNLVLPRGLLTELLKLTDSEEIAIAVDSKNSGIVFGVGETVLAGRILAGTFPDYEKIIPKVSTTKVNVAREELLRSIKLASVFARDSANKIILKVEESSITITSAGAKSGSQKAQVAAKVDGPTLEISFNFKFLEDVLSITTSESVDIGFTDPAKPGVFTDPKDTDFLHLVMPLKIQS